MPPTATASRSLQSVNFAIIEKGTMPEQKVYISSLVELPDLLEREDIHAPTLMIVGEVVKLNEKLNWYGN